MTGIKEQVFAESHSLGDVIYRKPNPYAWGNYQFAVHDDEENQPVNFGRTSTSLLLSLTILYNCHNGSRCTVVVLFAHVDNIDIPLKIRVRRPVLDTTMA